MAAGDAFCGTVATGINRARPPASPPCVHSLAGLDGPRLPPSLQRLAPRMLTLAPGERLFAEGEAQEMLYLVRHGTLKSRRHASDGEELVLDFHFAGDLIGRSLLSGRGHRSEAVALCTAELCGFPLPDLQRAMAECWELQSGVLQGIGRAIAHDHLHVRLLGRPRAQERLAGFLLELHQRQLDRGLPADRMLLPMGRAEIASYLGLVIETVSRAFTRLQEERVLRVSGRRLQLLDLERLCEIGGEHARQHALVAKRRGLG